MVTRIPTDAVMQDLLVANGIIPANDGVRMGDSNRVTADGGVVGADTETAGRVRAAQEEARSKMLRGSSTGTDNNYRHPTQIQCEQNSGACVVTPPLTTPGHGGANGIGGGRNGVGVTRGH